MFPKNETVYEEMIAILEHYKRYIPSKHVVLEEPIPGTSIINDKSYITTLLGGDYRVVIT